MSIPGKAGRLIAAVVIIGVVILVRVLRRREK